MQKRNLTALWVPSLSVYRNKHFKKSHSIKTLVAQKWGIFEDYCIKQAYLTFCFPLEVCYEEYFIFALFTR